MLACLFLLLEFFLLYLYWSASLLSFFVYLVSLVYSYILGLDILLYIINIIFPLNFFKKMKLSSLDY